MSEMIMFASNLGPEAVHHTADLHHFEEAQCHGSRTVVRATNFPEPISISLQGLQNSMCSGCPSIRLAHEGSFFLCANLTIPCLSVLLPDQHTSDGERKVLWADSQHLPNM